MLPQHLLLLLLLLLPLLLLLLLPVAHPHTTIAWAVAAAYKGQRRRRRRLSFVCRRLLLVAAAAAVLQVPGVLCGMWQAVGKHIKPDVTPNIATELFHVGAVNKCPATHPQRTSLRANPVLKSLNEI